MLPERLPPCSGAGDTEDAVDDVLATAGYEINCCCCGNVDLPPPPPPLLPAPLANCVAAEDAGDCVD